MQIVEALVAARLDEIEAAAIAVVAQPREARGEIGVVA